MQYVPQQNQALPLDGCCIVTIAVHVQLDITVVNAAVISPNLYFEVRTQLHRFEENTNAIQSTSGKSDLPVNFEVLSIVYSALVPGYMTLTMNVIP